MIVYPLHPQSLAGGSDSAVAYLRHLRQCTDDSSQPPPLAPADCQKRKPNTGAGAECNGRQQWADHGDNCLTSQAMQANASQRGSRDCSSFPHAATHNGSSEKVWTSKSTEKKAHPKHTQPKTQRMHDSTLRQSKSESESESKDESQSKGESESSSESSGTEGSGRIHTPTEGKQGAAGHARQATFERLDANFRSTSPGKRSLKRKVGQASFAHILLAA